MPSGRLTQRHCYMRSKWPRYQSELSSNICCPWWSLKMFVRRGQFMGPPTNTMCTPEQRIIRGESDSGWPTVKWNSFPGFSRGFSAKFQGFSTVFLTMLSKNIIITYRFSAFTHPPFILRFTWNFVSAVGKRGCLPHNKWHAVFTPQWTHRSSSPALQD